MVKGAPGNLQKEKIINKRKHAGRRPIGIKYFEARMVYRLRDTVALRRVQSKTPPFCQKTEKWWSLQSLSIKLYVML